MSTWPSAANDRRRPPTLSRSAAAFDVTNKRWRRKRRGKRGTYLFNAKALATVFRAKLLAALTAAGLSLPRACPSQWVVHCKAVGGGAKALIYLGRYLYRGVIREQAPGLRR